eukprot:CAMPEP_0185027718 /NCGR_PEP_ID=MMETSP1103-20130426/12936_1 /TAXON_ID=36769 /ORGANISM="Paraphysomonas bandaiensis, Strain Caron Lab Isolate" /LENGTH=462 /DNA_ID=CAMNT_0027561825 /DNA_START=92 /DNA_END=1480 /DNA_ORIENTATION=+
MDVGSLTDPYVKLCFLDNSNNTSKLNGIRLKSLTRMNTLDPVFHSYLAFPFIPSDDDILLIKVGDEDVSNRDDRIGTASVPFRTIKNASEPLTVELDMLTKLNSEDGMKSSVTLRLVHCGPTPLENTRKEIFVIRHGESKWNVGQASGNVKGMVSQYDHELTSVGIAQAQDFNTRWKAARDLHIKSSENGSSATSTHDTCKQEKTSDIVSDDSRSPEKTTCEVPVHDANAEHDLDFESFLSAEQIFASPLTRATQTALLTCEGHPLMATQGITLLRNLREIKNFGSFDTVGKYSGTDIVDHVKDVLAKDIGEDRANELMVDINYNDSVGPWWTPLEVKESKEDIRRRFEELWSFLRFGTTANTIILVGHSHFFRYMLHTHMSDEFRQRDPQWTAILDKAKLDNGACMKLSVEWDAQLPPMTPPVIHNAHLVFGSRLSGENDGFTSSESITVDISASESNTSQ